MRLIDADELIKYIEKVYDGYNLYDVVEHWKDLVNKQPTFDLWHYPTAGELPPKQEENHSMSSKCIVAIKGIISGKTYIDIARYDFSGKAWFSYPEGRVNVYAWKVEEPPKENA